MKPGRNFRVKLPVNAETQFKKTPEPEIVFFDLSTLDLEEEDEQTLFDLTEGNEPETLKEVAEQTTYGAVFLHDLIKRQRALSISVALVFLVIIFSLPLLTMFLRPLASFQIFGFEISWLGLAILIYPLIWGLAFYFVSTAEKYEEDFTKMVK